MASISSSQQPPMSEPNNGLDHCSSASPYQNPPLPLPEKSEDPLDVEEVPNLESNTVDETKPEMKIEPKTLESRGRPKKKEKHKLPVSEPKPEIEYSTQFQVETRDVFMPSDLVWGKVKNYPWWPGLIFDPSDASELALKHRNKNNFLVAYLYDNTFAWNEASVLKPFQTNFSRMVKQTSTDSFMSAVEEALSEVSRRVGSALSCGCYNGGESNAEPKFENAGIRANTARPSGDVSFIRSSFEPFKFLSFLSELGQNPLGGFDSLGLVVGKSQLKAFNRSRGCSFDLPEYCYTCAFDEENVSPVTSDRVYTRKPKSIDGDSSEKPILKKNVPEEAGRKKKRLSEIFNKEVMRTPKRCKVRVGGPSGSDNFPSGKYKKKRLDSLGDLGTKTRARRKYLRVGQCMRKAANHAVCSTSTAKPNGVTSRKRKCLSTIKDRVEKIRLQREKGILYSDKLPRGKSGTKKKKVLRGRKDDEGSFSLEDYSSSSDMLSQLHMAAQDPLKGYSFIPMIYSFFTAFRGYVLNPLAGKRSQRRSVARKLNLMEDEVRDSCMSDHIGGDNDNIKLITLCQKKPKSSKGVKDNLLESNSAISGANNGDLGNENKQKCNLGISGANPIGDLANENKQEPNLGISDADEREPIPEVDNSMPTAFGANPNSDLANENKQEANLGISDANKGERIPEVDGSMPTALVLNFEETAPLGDLANENKQEPNLGISDADEREPIPEVDNSMPTAFGANPNGDLANENKQEANLGISDANKGERIPEVDGSMPTALVLNFEETAPLPTKPELNGLFTRFGSLKEAETEVSEKENSAQVVFEKHVDAEVAFNDAGKLDAFRLDLVGFQLSCAPTSSNMEPTTPRLELQGGKDAASPVNAAC